MADAVTPDPDARISALFETLEHLVAGDYTKRAELSAARDLVDALGHGVNVLAGEVGLLTARLTHARDEARRASDEKGEHLRTLSHELRTPLAAILALLDLAEHPLSSPERRQALLTRAKVNVQSLLRLADDLVDMARIEAGLLRIDPEPCRPGDVATDVIESLTPEARLKGVAIELHGSSEPLLLDRVRLRQVLMNLVGNAVKYTERGRVVVSLAQQRERLVIDVSDTGIGIPPEGQASLFAPFVRHISGGVPGSGLGLAISRRIVDAMGGSISLVESAPGRGSTFRVELPFVAGSETPARPAPRPANGGLDGARVLLGEDDPDLGETVSHLLSLEGAKVVWERDGESICARAGAERFDLFLLDLGLPRLDGIAALERLRAAGDTTPAVALTGAVFSDAKEKCQAAGFDAHVAKGLSLPILYETLGRLLARGK